MTINDTSSYGVKMIDHTSTKAIMIESSFKNKFFKQQSTGAKNYDLALGNRGTVSKYEAHFFLVRKKSFLFENQSSHD